MNEFGGGGEGLFSRLRSLATAPSTLKAVTRLIFGRRLPVVSGAIEVPGLERAVRITRDQYGIPYIRAETEADAWYGLGFCQAQDRGFQLESLLRVVRGTLSELLGEQGLQVDRFSRRIGFHRSGQAQVANLEPDIRQRMNAFVRGINHGITNGGPRPHELALLRQKPSFWEAADVLALLKLQGIGLASNWDSELARLKILVDDGPEAVTALEPLYPTWHPLIQPVAAAAGPAVDRLAADLAAVQAVVGQMGGSNNWVVSGEKTSTGRPQLANDPHLGPTLPPHWYLAHVSTQQWRVAGASFVGAPGFPCGHNDVAAWGVTAGFADNTDLHIEEILSGRDQVRGPDGPESCQIIQEKISIRGKKAVTERVLVTRRGPIVSPFVPGDLGAISMAACWLGSGSVRGVLDLQTVTCFADFQRSLSKWPAVSLNMVYADTSGDIGWQLIGDLPRRKSSGSIPTPGWQSTWSDDVVPFEQMPNLLNPDCGYLATANNQHGADQGWTAGDGEGPEIVGDFLDGYRQARIVERLGEKDDWSIDDHLALQVDRLCLPWREMRDVILSLPKQIGLASDELHAALAHLSSWDGVLEDDAAAGIFQFFLAAVIAKMVRAKAPNSAEWALGKGFSPLLTEGLLAKRRVGQLVDMIRQQPDGWFDVGWPTTLADALTAAMRTLVRRFGPDTKNWRWASMRQLEMIHPLGRRPPLDHLFNLGPVPCGGDANTVAQAAAAPFDPAGNPTAIASLRAVIDVGAWENSRWILPGGQSGNPLSPHFSDMWPSWQQGKAVPMAWTDEQIKKATIHQLRLTPL